MPKIAITALIKLTVAPTIFGLSLWKIALADSPAELAARKLVVTVERTIIITPGIPRFARRIARATLFRPHICNIK